MRIYSRILIMVCCISTILLTSSIAYAQIAGPDWRYNTWLGYGYNTASNYIQGVQMLLIDHGYSVGSTGADGYWGTNTENAVKQFQSNHGISSTGTVANATWGKFQDHLIYAYSGTVSGQTVHYYTNYGTSAVKWGYFSSNAMWDYKVPPQFTYWQWFADYLG